MMNRPLFLGLGSPHGDDQAGWLVIEFLHRCGVPVADAMALHSPDEIYHRCALDRELILCDAAAGTYATGTIRRWLWPGFPLPERRHGSHDLPLGEVLSLGQTLGLCPAEVVIWTITGNHFAPGDEISASVRKAAESLANSLCEECGHA